MTRLLGDNHHVIKRVPLDQLDRVRAAQHADGYITRVAWVGPRPERGAHTKRQHATSANVFCYPKERP